MPVLIMPLPQTQLLGRTLRELCRRLSSFPHLQMSEQECIELAGAAIGGHPEAEFTVASLFDAAGHPDSAFEWYHRSADRDYLPAMLQLAAIR